MAGSINPFVVQETTKISFECKLSLYHAQLSYNCGRVLPINHRVAYVVQTVYL